MRMQILFPPGKRAEPATVLLASAKSISKTVTVINHEVAKPFDSVCQICTARRKSEIFQTKGTIINNYSYRRINYVLSNAISRNESKINIEDLKMFIPSFRNSRPKTRQLLNFSTTRRLTITREKLSRYEEKYVAKLSPVARNS